MIEYSIIYDFLNEETNKEILEKAKKLDYASGKIRGNQTDNDYRKVSIHRGIPDEYKLLFEGNIKNLVEVNNFEFQLTMNTDGDFYKAHPDTDPNSKLPIIKNRTHTFIYYMFDSPKKFEGGDLIIYDKTDDFMVYNKEEFEKIDVQNNMLIWFPSEYWHEVTLITNNGHIDSNRFTVNAWVH